MVKNHDSIDPNNPWENKKCSTATRRLEKGPAQPNNYSGSNKFTDLSFNGTDQLYWEDYSTGDSSTWLTYLNYNYYDFMRIPDFNSSSPLFDSQGAHFNDIEQGGAGTCYILASFGAIAEFPDLVYSMFVSG